MGAIQADIIGGRHWHCTIRPLHRRQVDKRKTQLLRLLAFPRQYIEADGGVASGPSAGGQRRRPESRSQRPRPAARHNRARPVAAAATESRKERRGE